MNESIKKGKSEANYKPKYKQTETTRNPEAYFKSKLYWKDRNDGHKLCPTCKQHLTEEEAMNAPNGELIHEDCYEPGESNY